MRAPFSFDTPTPGTLVVLGAVVRLGIRTAVILLVPRRPPRHEPAPDQQRQQHDADDGIARQLRPEVAAEYHERAERVGGGGRQDRRPPRDVHPRSEGDRHLRQPSEGESVGAACSSCEGSEAAVPGSAASETAAAASALRLRPRRTSARMMKNAMSASSRSGSSAPVTTMMPSTTPTKARIASVKVW